MAKLAHDERMLAKVLEYHVVKGALTAAQVEKRSTLTGLQDGERRVKVRAGSADINQAKVVKATVKASNGVVHVINSVLIPHA